MAPNTAIRMRRAADRGIGEQPQIDERLVVGSSAIRKTDDAEHRGDASRRRSRGESNHSSRWPSSSTKVRQLKPDRHGDDAQPVGVLELASPLRPLGIERVELERDRQQAGHDVEIEDVVPAPDSRSASRRPWGRSPARRSRPCRTWRCRSRCLSAGRRRAHDGDGGRDQHAAGEALAGAPDDHLGQAVRHGAEDREADEQRRVDRRGSGAARRCGRASRSAG